MQTLKKGNSEAKKFQAEKDFEKNLEYINGIDKRLANTFHTIEADDYAFHMIWKEYFYDVHESARKYEFVQDHSGFARQIGIINKKPVMLNFRWWIVNGHPVLFYGCNSQVVDWEMIEDWLKKYMPHVKYTSDAANAHNVFSECKKIEPKQKEVPRIKCYTCMDSKQVEERRIGYDSIMGPCTNCR